MMSWHNRLQPPISPGSGSSPAEFKVTAGSGLMIRFLHTTGFPSVLRGVPVFVRKVCSPPLTAWHPAAESDDKTLQSQGQSCLSIETTFSFTKHLM